MATASAVLDDCTLVADDLTELKVGSEMIRSQWSELVPLMECLSTNGGHFYRIQTRAPQKIVTATVAYLVRKEISDAEDWLFLEQLLEQARKWKLKELENAIAEIFVRGIDEKNCVSVWRKCKRMSSSLTQRAFESVTYLLNKAVGRNRSFEFYQLRVNDLFEILDSDLLHVENEVSVWNMIEKWVRAYPQRRSVHVSRLLSAVRFECLSDSEAELIKKSDLLNGVSLKKEMGSAKGRRCMRDALIACCGWHRSEPSVVLEVFDVATNLWKRIPFADHSRKLAYHACVVLHQKLYVIGGHDGTKYFNDVFCFDGATLKWSEVAPMHFARCYVAACEVDGTIFACGGSDGSSDNRRLRSAEKYDVTENQWIKIRSMLTPRSDAAACGMKGRVYVAGGFTGRNVLQTVEVYFIETDLWVEVALMASPRSGLGCVLDEDCIIIAGGFDGLQRLDTVEKMRIGSSHCTRMPSLPRPRSNFGMCKYGSKICVVGGYEKQITGSMLEYENGKWEEKSELSLPRSGLQGTGTFNQ